MARDCPDRQRGANWRNDGPGGPPGPSAGRIGGSGDVVDREMEVSLANFQLNNKLLMFLATHARTFWWCSF
jgi:hypothetical protein